MRNLFWIDTRDMIPDGLTKGSVDRAALQAIVTTNCWKKIGHTPSIVSSAILGPGSQIKFEVDNISFSVSTWLDLSPILDKLYEQSQRGQVVSPVRMDRDDAPVSGFLWLEPLQRLDAHH